MASTHLPALSNVAPFHLLTQASVEDLNRKVPDLKTPITALNFRLRHIHLVDFILKVLKGSLLFQTKYCGEDFELRAIPRGSMEAHPYWGCCVGIQSP